MSKSPTLELILNLLARREFLWRVLYNINYAASSPRQSREPKTISQTPEELRDAERREKEALDHQERRAKEEAARAPAKRQEERRAKEVERLERILRADQKRLDTMRSDVEERPASPKNDEEALFARLTEQMRSARYAFTIQTLCSLLAVTRLR